MQADVAMKSQTVFGPVDATGPAGSTCPGAVSIVIPARDEGDRIGAVVSGALAQSPGDRVVEVIIVDDGSSDGTAIAAHRAGARVLLLPLSRGNPGAARNAGAAAARGDVLVFLDADCTPAPGWLQALLDAHAEGSVAVGGAIEAAPDQGIAARCNHYCGFYHTHPGRARGDVLNHPPANLSVRRDVFLEAGGFCETQPVADGHEELAWQERLRQAGHAIHFEPSAVVLHRYRPGWLSLLRRNYRWAYSALRSKRGSAVVRFAWLYRRPVLLIAAAPALALVHTGHTLFCWARAGVLEPIAMLPAVLAARVAYAAGFMIGGIRWLQNPMAECRPLGGRWR
jgi:glycosyltransferase involved in cell wall biosynthesis